jgi:hypothetical protein
MQREREVQEQGLNPNPAGGGGPAGGTDLNRTREELRRLQEAGQESIRRALAGQNSEAFLRASQQHGGE